jgi:hypothetical protein
MLLRPLTLKRKILRCQLDLVGSVDCFRLILFRPRVKTIFSGECRTFEEIPGTSERLIGQRLDCQADAPYQR